MDGYLIRLKNEHRTAMYVAWHQAAFQRSKTMPPLHKVTGGKPGKRAQTAGEMLAVMGSFAAAQAGRHNEDRTDP